MRICREKKDTGWTLEDFEPGDVIKVGDADYGTLIVLKHDDQFLTSNDHISRGFPLPAFELEDGEIYWFDPREVIERYPNACIKLGEPEKR